MQNRSSNNGAPRRRSSRGGAFNGYGARRNSGGGGHVSGSFRHHRSAQSRGGSRQGGGFGKYIDPARFINKAVITEEKVVHFKPEHQFVDFNIDEKLKKNIVQKGYILPSPIQDKAIPHILNGSDVVGIANTGTGKTAAFLLPLINKVLTNRQEKILITAPTRELAIQIEQELTGFAYGMQMYGVCCVGGAHIGRQITGLRRQHNFVIGTPGRIKDLIERGVLDLSKFKTVVLDEADRMLDMGFIHDMKFMMSKMPADRHTLFFSATMSKEIERLIQDFLKEPVMISVKTSDTSKSVDQDVVRLAGKNKLEVLHDLLIQGGFSKVLVFGKTKSGVDRLGRALTERGFKAESIHGDKNHARRQRALSAFKNDQVQVLVATDVAARGIDVSDVSHVINFDLPATYEDYVHRIGRTGRGGKKGKALTFVE